MPREIGVKMKTAQIQIQAKIISLSFVVLVLGTACGQNPLAPGMGFGGSDDSSFGIDPSLNVTTIPYALLSSEQMFKSMSSVTNTPISASSMNEYNARQAVFASGYDLKLVTSPMLIAVTNLSSVFCNETVTRERNLPASQRRLFSDIDFTKSINDVSTQNFQGAAQKMSQAFWGRSPSSVELQILSEGKAEFFSALTAQEASATASSRNLMLFTCTAMLSSFDSYQF